MKTSLLILLFALAVSAKAQSIFTTCSDGRITLRPAWLASEVSVQSASSLNGPWYEAVHVGDKKSAPCPALEFTLPKLQRGEAMRFWRLIIIR